MKDNETKEMPMQKVWLNALKTFGKIMLCLIVIYFFVVMSIFFLNPKLAAGMFGSMGLKNAEESCLEMEYNQNQTQANLYNLVVFEAEQKNYQAELIYIDLLLGTDNYEEFCDKLDMSSYGATKNNKSLAAVSSNVNSYLINQKVICMYNLGMKDDTILTSIGKWLGESKVAENSFSTYVELIIADKTLSDLAKINKLKTINQNYHSIIEKLDVKIEVLETLLNQDDISAKDQLVYQYSLLGNLRGKYLVYLNIYNEKDEAEKAAFKLIEEEYQKAINDYNKLINS